MGRTLIIKNADFSANAILKALFPVESYTYPKDIPYAQNNNGFTAANNHLYGHEEGYVRTIEVVTNWASSTTFDGKITLVVVTIDSSKKIEAVGEFQEFPSEGNNVTQTISTNIHLASNQILLIKGIGFNSKNLPTSGGISTIFTTNTEGPEPGNVPLKIGNTLNMYAMYAPIAFNIER